MGGFLLSTFPPGSRQAIPSGQGRQTHPTISISIYRNLHPSMWTALWAKFAKMVTPNGPFSWMELTEDEFCWLHLSDCPLFHTKSTECCCCWMTNSMKLYDSAALTSEFSSVGAVACFFFSKWLTTSRAEDWRKPSNGEREKKAWFGFRVIFFSLQSPIWGERKPRKWWKTSRPSRIQCVCLIPRDSTRISGMTSLT